MCGIVGYVGDRDISSVLVVGLERLSYRGYDSAGIGVVSEDEVCVWKKPGKVHVLAKQLESLNIQSNAGIGHTRWATHGIPNDVNAHPHFDAKKRFAIVHNGIIENYLSLKSDLVKEGFLFRSQTDSEVIVHLIDKFYDGCFVEAVKVVINQLEGSFSIAAISARDPDAMIVCRKNSPLIIGIGCNEYFVSSDAIALVPHTKQVVYLNDMHVAYVSKKGIELFDENGKNIAPTIQKIPWSHESSEKMGYDFFMQKEICEQPKVVRTILETYVSNNTIVFPTLAQSSIDFSKTSRFIIQACGTSWHAGLIAKYLIEDLARIPTEVDISSEFRYRRLLSTSNEVVVAISQSGETADTLACIREAKSKFFNVLSFVNVAGSSIDRESDAVIYTQSGPEIGVASTKNYLAQILTLYLFALHLGQSKGVISTAMYEDHLQHIQRLPVIIDQILQQEAHIQAIAKTFLHAKSFIFIGRGLNFPTALEGALKLKEISYIHATGYAAGELKHGPIALIDEQLPVVCICPKNNNYEKMMSNIQEVKARGGQLILIATQGDTSVDELSDHVIRVPDTPSELAPLVGIIPLQLMAYHIALNLGCDVDQPRNLAKSVTVE